MSRFSERLKNIVDDAGITQYMLAKNANVDRPTLCRILSGTRQPSEENRQRLYDALSLPQTTRAELEELAEMDRDGETLTLQRREVIKLVEAINDHEFRSGAVPANKTVELPEQLKNRLAYTCSGSLATDSLVRSIVEAEYYGNEHTEILLFCPFGYELLYSLIYEPGYEQPGRLVVHHIIGLESMSSTSGVRNLKIMQQLLPFALNCAGGYKAVHFHELRSNIGRFHTPFPYFAIINDTMLMLETDFKGAVMIKEREVIELYRAQFYRYYEQSKPFSLFYKTVLESLLHNNDVDSSFNVDKYSLMFPNPAICAVFAPEVIIDHRRRDIPGIEELAAKCLERFKYIHDNSGQIERQFFSMEGLDEFIETGYSYEIPRELIYPFTLEERIELVSAYRDLCAQGTSTFIIRPEKVSVPRLCTIKVCRNVVDFSVSVQRQNLNTALITDESVCAAMQEFAEYLPNSRYVYTPQEAAEELDRRLEKLRARVADETTGCN